MTDSEKQPLPKLEILAMRDDTEKLTVKKRSAFNLPMRLLITGKSMLSGKSTLCGNYLLRPFDQTDESGAQFYKNDFEGNDIYVICPSTLVDKKWQSIIKGKRIPPENIYDKYDEQELTDLYDKLESEYFEAVDEGKHPAPKLVIMDDCSFSGDFKAKISGILAKYFCNGRHWNISIICTAQKWDQFSTVMRENCTGACIFASSQRQNELIYNDVATMPKREFLEMLQKATHKKHSFLVVNYSNDPDERFLDCNFQKIE